MKRRNWGTSNAVAKITVMLIILAATATGVYMVSVGIRLDNRLRAMFPEENRGVYGSNRNSSKEANRRSENDFRFDNDCNQWNPFCKKTTQKGPLISLPKNPINPYKTDPDTYANYINAITSVVSKCQKNGFQGAALRSCFCDSVSGGCASGSVAADIGKSLAIYSQGSNGLQCVEYVASILNNLLTSSPITIQSTASQLVASKGGWNYCSPNSKGFKYQEGDILVFNENYSPGNEGHVGVVTGVSTNGKIQVSEANRGGSKKAANNIVNTSGVTGVLRAGGCN